MTALVQPPPVLSHSRYKKSPWWVCPSSRELSLRSEIRMGYSTIGSRIAKNKHSPILGPNVVRLTEKEISSIKAVLARAKELERLEQMHSRSLMMEYEQLKTSCRGNGIDNCVLCGYDHTSSEKKLQLVTCDKCSKIACTTCYQMKQLSSGALLTLCKLCYDYQELWCKTGAWMTNKLPKQVSISDEELELYKQQELMRTRGSVGDILGDVQIQLNQEFLTGDEDEEESEEELLKTDTMGSYKGVKFFEFGSSNDNKKQRSPTPMSILDISDESRTSPFGDRSELRRSRALSSENRPKLCDIRDRVNKKVTGGNDAPSSGVVVNRNLSGFGTSFDSLESGDFEPLRIHESMEEKDDDPKIVISMPSLHELPGSAATCTLDDSDTCKESSSSESEEDVLSSDNSDFEIGDVELPRTMSFSRTGACRAPIRIGMAEKKRSIETDEDKTTDKESDKEEILGAEHIMKGEEHQINEVKVPIDDTESQITHEKEKLPEQQAKVQWPKSDDNSDEDDSIHLLDIPDTIMDNTGVTSEDPISDTPTRGHDTPIIGDTPPRGDLVTTVVDTDETTFPTMDMNKTSIDSTTDVAHYDTQYSSVTSSPVKIQLQSEPSDDNKDTDQSTYRFRRRNATRNSGRLQGTTPTSSDTEGGASMSKDALLMSKREKARMAARRLRERKDMSSSRSGQMADNAPIPKPRTRRVEYSHKDSLGKDDGKLI